MFKQLALATLVLLSPNFLYAKTAYKHDYKAKHPIPVNTQITAAPPLMPCNTYTFNAGPYAGVSMGARTNYNNTPSVYKGLEGAFFVGYGLTNNSFYLAGELFAQAGLMLQNYYILDPNADASYSIRSTWSYGISMLPGFLLADNILGYLRIGFIRTNFVAQNPSNGGQVGLGMQTALGENWDIRVEYSYSFFQSFNLSNGVDHPRSDMYSLGLIYKI